MNNKLIIGVKEERYRNDPLMFFDLNNDNYETVTNDIEKTPDFVLHGYAGNTHYKLLNLAIFHNYENQYSHLLNIIDESPTQYIITNCEHREKLVHERIRTVDFLFNRTKAYYTRFPFRDTTFPWYCGGTDAYVEGTLPIHNKTKIFVAPNKTYRGTRLYRTQLVEFLSKYSHLGYTSNYAGEIYIENSSVLYSQLECPRDVSISDIEQKTDALLYPFLGYLPPHNAYYDNSFVSIYGETIEFGDTYAVTEKTYDPLMKCHFILPFSCFGYVQYLRDKGIQMPNFIDYSYDLIQNDKKRFDAYVNEVARLMTIDLEQWQQHYYDNIDLLYQNKRWVHSMAYDCIDIRSFIRDEG